MTDDFVSAHGYAVGKADDGAFWPPAAARKFVGRRDAHDLGYAGKDLEVFVVKVRRRAYAGQYGLNGSCGAVDVEANHYEAFDYALDVFFGRGFLHGNNHDYFPVSPVLPGPLGGRQFILLQRAHYVDDAFVDVREFDVREGTLVSGPNIFENHLFPVRFVDREFGGTLQLADCPARHLPAR